MDFVNFFFCGLCSGLIFSLGLWFIRFSIRWVKGIFSDSPVWEDIGK